MAMWNSGAPVAKTFEVVQSLVFVPFCLLERSGNGVNFKDCLAERVVAILDASSESLACEAEG